MMLGKIARSRMLAAPAAALCAFVAMAQQTGPAESDVALDRTTVAVLPLEFVGNDPKLAELAASVHAVLSTQISAVNGLNVVDAGRLLPLVDAGLDPEEIARTLGVVSVITGSLHPNYGEWRLDLRYRNVVNGGRGGTGGAIVGDIASGSLYADRIMTAAAHFAAMAEHTAFGAPQPSLQQALEAMRAKILDTSLADAERVNAVLETIPFCESCRSIRAEALGGYIAEVLAQLAVQSTDPSARANAWRALEGVDEPVLIRPLVDSLATDTDEHVRREAAARLIEGFLDEPDVRAVVERAAETDASGDVRNHIRFSLLSDEEQAQRLWDVALDVNRSDRERLTAILEICCGDGQIRELPHELVVAALQIGARADREIYRRWAWDFLADSRDPYLVEPYLEWLGTEPNEELREVAARGLGAFLDRPGVRAALEEAAHDSALAVRMAAAESLRGS